MAALIVWAPGIFVSFCWKIPMPIKFLLLGGFGAFWKGRGEVPILLLWAWGIFPTLLMFQGPGPFRTSFASLGLKPWRRIMGGWSSRSVITPLREILSKVFATPQAGHSIEPMKLTASWDNAGRHCATLAAQFEIPCHENPNLQRAPSPSKFTPTCVRGPKRPKQTCTNLRPHALLCELQSENSSRLWLSAIPCWKSFPANFEAAGQFFTDFPAAPNGKCYPSQGLGSFRQGKWLLENRPRLRERSWIFSSETATALLSFSAPNRNKPTQIRTPSWKTPQQRSYSRGGGGGVNSGRFGARWNLLK